LKVCALIAAFNEEQHVAEAVGGALRHVGCVLVVDDGSSDRTKARAEAAGARVVRHETNRGKGCAIRTGLEILLREDHTHVLFMDADLQHDPEDLPRLLAMGRSGSGDFVLGERRFQKEAMPAARFYSNVVGSRILSYFIRTPVLDSQSGFRLIRSDLLRRLALTGTGYEIETEMLIKLARGGARLDRVTVGLRYQGAQSKIRPFRDTFRTCMLALRYRYLES
jgi:glycosyltransferase involved in cell wall biosynthesis